MVAALLHNSTNPRRGVRRPRRDRRRQRARPSPARPGLVLPADDGLHARLAVPGRRAGELAAGARLNGRRAKAMLADRAFRDAVRAELATAGDFRLFNGEWDKVHVVEARSPSCAPRAAQHRRDRRRRRPRSARRDARPRARRGPETVFTAQLLNCDEDAVGRMLQPPAQHRQPERRRRAPHVLQRRRLRPAPARPLGARPRRDEPGRSGAPAHGQPASVFGIAAAARSRRATPPTCCCSTRRRSAAARSGASTTCPAARRA